MSQIDRIVFTTIDRQTAQISVRSFDVPLLLVKVGEDEAPSFEGIIQKFTSLEAVTGVFGLEHNATKMAAALLSSSQRPSEFYIGKVGETQTYQEALMAVANEDNDWYAVVIDSTNAQEIEELAKVIQGTKKVFFANTKDADVLSASVDTDIASKLSEAGLDRTALIFSEKADVEFPAAVWVGECITALVGSNSWEYKTLAGVTRSKLSDNQIEVLESKNCNYYIRVLGADVTRRGYMASGEWIDTLIIQDWTNARFQERIFFRKKNLPKIPLMLAA